MAVLISLSMIVSVSEEVGRPVSITHSITQHKGGYVLLNPVLLRRKKKNRVALKEATAKSEQAAPFMVVGRLRT